MTLPETDTDSLSALRSSSLERDSTSHPIPGQNREMSFSPAPFTWTLLISAAILSLPANATRPLIRGPASLKNLDQASPVNLETVLEKDLVGLDQEPSAQRKLILKQAQDYSDLRSGKQARGSLAHWYADCFINQVGHLNQQEKIENPFCRFEFERRQSPNSPRPKRASRPALRGLANEIAESRYESAETRSLAEVIGAAGLLESKGRLDEVSNQVVEKKECVPSKLSYALGFKNEERFPASENIEVAKRLYRKASTCAKDLAAAQASFRLGLIQIWQNQCEEIPALMQKVEATAEASAFHPRARYWRYHCANITNDKSARQAAKDLLLREHPMSFHALAVGADESSMNSLIRRETPKVAMRSVVRSDLNSLLRASEALAMIGSKQLAAEMIDRHVREIGTMEPPVRLYVASLLNRLGYALPAFKILAELFQDAPNTVTASTLRLFFPLWYLDDVKAKNSHVDPLLILSLIRQESAFNKEARSPVGARGLMQVMPGTARSVASIRAHRLFDPSTNISVGSKYFMKRLSQYGGDVELTLAAYNAGFMRVDQWKKRYPTANKLLFLDLIPFRETRDYVSSILRNYFWYVKLYDESTRAEAEKPKELIPVATAGAKIQSILGANAGVAAAPQLGSMSEADATNAPGK